MPFPKNEVADLHYNEFFNLIKSKTPNNFVNLSVINNSLDFLHTVEFNNLMENSPTIMGVHNYATVSYDYFSPNIKKILGIKAKELTGIDAASFTMQFFHPDQLPIFTSKIMPVVMKYFNEYSAIKRAKDLRFSIILKLRRSDGTYIWALMQTVVMEVSKEGFPLRTVFFISDINDLKSDNKIDLTFSIKNNHSGYDTIYSAHFENEKSSVLSKRELEVIVLVGKGKKSTEIADCLNISIATVNTHRRNILEKTGKANIIQLLDY